MAMPDRQTAAASARFTMHTDDEVAAAVHGQRHVGAFAGTARIFKPHSLAAAAGIAVQSVRFTIEQRHAHAAFPVAAVSHRRPERSMRKSHVARSFQIKSGIRPFTTMPCGTGAFRICISHLDMIK